MNFLGIIWIASYVGSFFSPQSLVRTSDYLSKALPARVLSAITSNVDRAALNQAALASNALTPRVTPSHREGVRANGIPSLLQPFSRLNPQVTGALFGTGTRNQVHSATSSSSLGLPFQVRSTPASNRMVKLVGSLSNWSQSIKETVSHVAVAVVRSQGSSSATNANVKSPDAKRAGTGQCERSGRKAASRRSTSEQTAFQIQVKGKIVAEVPTQAQAEAIAQNLRHLLEAGGLDPSKVRPAMVNRLPGAKAGNSILFTIDEKLASILGRNPELIAINWVNNLRTALGVQSLTLAEAQTQMHSLRLTGEKFEGTASWYGPYFHGRRTAIGEIFDQNELTAAHPSLPFNTYLEVTNLRNGNTVVVRINDRGPYVGNRSLDLSRAAARCLNSENRGVVPYRAVILRAAPAETVDVPTVAKLGSQIVAQRIVR